ncbi:alpha/beta fold hydrolase [Actinoplanes aureus]|uniref:Alpha/beta fold hydrolase n=1 Tax=Actinoplanes aureus TaxID=2792083 RepID=A0A931FVC5_9ACTN|nr:alpha/beta fold hydrolase [Actinoplanes aureus]MBG0560115.1 alpha/beta fold hydrolase [Actinoplanes aureus]
MRFRVLGAVRAYAEEGSPVALGDRRRALLAALLARAGRVVPADRLVDLLWPEDPPADPAGSLHSQMSRLRRALPGVRIDTAPPGYVLRVEPDEIDAGRFDRLVAAARDTDDACDLLSEALGLWQGPAYAGFADTEIARLEAIRLEEARLHAAEAWHRSLLAAGRPEQALPELEAFVVAHPLREQARDTLMRTLYALGRHADALECYRQYATRLADELGLEPSAAIQQTRLRILRQNLPGSPAPVAPLSALQARYLSVPGGRTVAAASLGDGPPLIAVPGWVSSIDVIASGRDPRSSLLQRLVGHTAVTVYDRYGTGLSRGPVDDFGLDAAVDELAAVAEHAGAPVHLLAMSEAGPQAVALAATRPELVSRLIFFGTYASGPATFLRADLNNALVTMVRTHWGLGSKLFAGLFRPDATDDAARHLAEVLRDSADRDVAASYLATAYDVDVSHLLPEVRQPALVLHYRGDRVIPFAGARQLATGLPDARLTALDGPYHLPDVADLDRVVTMIDEFLRD